MRHARRADCKTHPCHARRQAAPGTLGAGDAAAHDACCCLLLLLPAACCLLPAASACCLLLPVLATCCLLPLPAAAACCLLPLPDARRASAGICSRGWQLQGVIAQAARWELGRDSEGLGSSGGSKEAGGGWGRV